MRSFTTLAAIWIIFGSISYATIEGFQQIKIDFTNPEEADLKARWSEPDKITVSKDGLGWDGNGAASRDGWIQTKPIALGLSWRPTYAIFVRFCIQPPPQEFMLNNGQKMTADAGDAYVRYSPDLKHWSSWQVLQRSEPQSLEERKKPGRHYSGMIRVPYVERNEYSRLVSDYSRMDTPWKSDEEAAVQWILNRDPEFFSKQIPFIGYAEFRFEGGFRGGQRIQALKADVSYGMGGMHSPPKDDAVYKIRNVPWRYEYRRDMKAEPNAPANGASPLR